MVRNVSNRDIFKIILTQYYPLLATGLKSGHTFNLTNKTIQDLKNATM